MVFGLSPQQARDAPILMPPLKLFTISVFRRVASEAPPCMIVVVGLSIPDLAEHAKTSRIGYPNVTRGRVRTGRLFHFRVGDPTKAFNGVFPILKLDDR